MLFPSASVLKNTLQLFVVLWLMKETMGKQGENFISSLNEVIIQPWGTVNLGKEINYK